MSTITSMIFVGRFLSVIPCIPSSPGALLFLNLLIINCTSSLFVYVISSPSSIMLF